MCRHFNARTACEWPKVERLDNVVFDVVDDDVDDDMFDVWFNGVLVDSFSSFQFSSRWHRSARKGPYALRPVSQQSPQGCPRNSADICLVEHRSFSALEGGMSAASSLHSSFLQAINAVMHRPVHVQKAPQASEHSALPSCRPDVISAALASLATRALICPFIPTDSGLPRTVDPQKSLWPKTVHGCVLVGAAHSRLHLLQEVH